MPLRPSESRLRKRLSHGDHGETSFENVISVFSVFQSFGGQYEEVEGCLLRQGQNEETLRRTDRRHRRPEHPADRCGIGTVRHALASTTSATTEAASSRSSRA